MAEKAYIEREAAFNAILKLVPKVDDDGYCWVIRGDAATAIAAIPAADVRPVCRGKWKKANDSYCCGITEDGDSITLPTVRCSVCKKLIAPIIWKNFCPNCGADMREKS